MIDENEPAIIDALHKDLRKHPFEARVMEIALVRGEIWEMIDNIDSWSRGEKAHTEGVLMIENCRIEPDPLGTVLIIGAWNYPIQVTLLPLVGAIAAGNTAVVKPSEVAEHSAALMEELLSRYFPKDIVGVVNGGVKETTALLDEKFDHIIYTGSGRVGKIIMSAAAKHLTPVTLELGGKSPTIVDDVKDMQVVAQRIMWGKAVNAGQTCIAPDYIFVKKGETKTRLIEELKKAREKFYGANVSESTSYPRMINEMHYKRVKDMLKNGKVVVGGETDDATRFIAPSVIDEPDPKSPLMTDEIFGPVLPLLEFDDVQEVIDYINDHDKPLALYIFSTNSVFSERIIKNTSSGAVVVNDTLMHAGVPGLPFGGVGGSGMGAYHGKHSFDLFSHKKAIMRRNMMMESANALRYAPYKDSNYNLMKALLLKTGPRKVWVRYAVMAAVGTLLYLTIIKRFFTQ